LHNCINCNVFNQLPRVQSSGKLRRIVIYVKNLDKDLQVMRKYQKCSSENNENSTLNTYRDCKKEEEEKEDDQQID